MGSFSWTFLQNKTMFWKDSLFIVEKYDKATLLPIIKNEVVLGSYNA